jgi:hypothetical protein
VQVLDDPRELQNPMPNPQAMSRLATLSGGQVLPDAAALAAVLRELPRSEGPPVVKKTPLWDSAWLLALLVGLLTIEWLGRRSVGLARCGTPNPRMRRPMNAKRRRWCWARAMAVSLAVLAVPAVVASPGVWSPPSAHAAEAEREAESAAARVLQMKELVRRFSAILDDDWSGGRKGLRLISTPIWRYKAPESGAQDGAIFSFATNGTNPTVLLLIELNGKEPAKASWRYAPLRMGTGGMALRLDEKEVWSVARVTWHPSVLTSWVFFSEKEGALR